MRTGKNLMTELNLFWFQLKNIRSIFVIPLIIYFIFIPFILIMTMKKYNDIWYVEDTFMVLTQYFVPVFSVWWISFAFIDLVEGEGNELHYVNHRMKDNLALLWLGLYLATIGIGCCIGGIWIDNAGMEFIRMSICSCFYVGLLYAVMFWSNSMTFSFLAVILYWMSSVFGEQFPINTLNCYDSAVMSMELLSGKYTYIMLAAILFFVAGCIGNGRKQKYN